MSNQADIYKTQGNAALQARQFDDAVDLYSKAIALDPSNHVYFSNRAAAYASLEKWREALDDSFEVVTLKPDWVKGWVRRGGAFTGLGQHEEARKAYLKATHIEPANEQVKQLLQAAEDAVAKTKEKNWEDDLWSDDDDEQDAGKKPAASSGGGGGGASSKAAAAAAAAAGSKRAATDEDDADRSSAKRSRRKPSASLVAQLDRSLKDASEDTLRACLGQIASSDEELAERALHILEGLNAASSAGEDDDDDGSGDDRGGAAAQWLRASASSKGARNSQRRGRGGGGSDSD